MEKSSYGLAWIFQKTNGIRPQLAVYTLLVLFLPVMQLLFAYFMKLFIDIATGSADLPLLQVALRTVVLVALGGAAIMINAVLVKWISGRMECSLRAELMEIIFSRLMTDIARQHSGEILTKLTADVQAVTACLPTMIDNIAGGVVSALLATAALFFLNWKIALILLVLTPLLMGLMGCLTPHIQNASAGDKKNDEINRTMLQENLSRIMLVKTYFMQEKIVGKLRSIYQNKLKSGMKLGMWEGLASFAGMLFGNAMSLTALGLGSYFVLKGETTVGSLIMIVQLLNYIIAPISALPTAIAQVTQAVVSAGRIGTLCELPADREIPPAAPVHVSGLTVRDLGFSYSGQEHLLAGVNMSFSVGEVTGIAGQSGSGKSTLLRLLIGLYTPGGGTVELMHTSGTLCGEEIMAQAAYVPPDDYLFSGSIIDNILMAEGEPHREELRASAAEANILAFIDSLPQGFDTVIGEGGGTVSSGQAQRIAIARAIYKKARVIIFDEPTANLDADSIEKFHSAVKRIAKDRICILVTHEPSTIAVCDKVYQLENGTVREQLKSS